VSGLLVPLDSGSGECVDVDITTEVSGQVAWMSALVHPAHRQPPCASPKTSLGEVCTQQLTNMGTLLDDRSLQDGLVPPVLRLGQILDREKDTHRLDTARVGHDPSGKGGHTDVSDVNHSQNSNIALTHAGCSPR